MVSALFGKGRLFLGAQYCPLLENRSNTSANGPATRPEGARGFMRCAGLGCCGRCIADLGHLTGPLSTSRNLCSVCSWVGIIQPRIYHQMEAKDHNQLASKELAALGLESWEQRSRWALPSRHGRGRPKPWQPPDSPVLKSKESRKALVVKWR
ncbi:unnamed protein product [Rangifer tarandus platyrhynchus]|uniref:Uncharacterized protein n=1 Tax=Rangifer tarandus platyrhynchus TaxID=3082113 RepID=A0ABN8XVT0_RANTA|nr:unnamed protein product [Rangifer tarandus platyrhynchus]